MSANFNRVVLLGNLTRDVEIRMTQGGVAIAKLGLAINSKRTDKAGNATETVTFVDLTAFGKQAEVLAKYVAKGSPLFVEGRLDFQTWQNQQGETRNKLGVVIEQFQFLGGKKPEDKKPEPNDDAPDDFDDRIPF